MAPSTQVKKSIRRTKGTPFLGKAHFHRGQKIAALKAKIGKVSRDRSAPRLYMKGTLAGYKRGLWGQNKNSAHIRVENVNTKEDAAWYVGKRVCYVYHGYKMKRCVRWSKAPARRSNTRAIWGRVMKPHGGSGMLAARFKKTVPANALGKRIRVYLYPSRI
eukprot:Tbor_TRINITY_DN4255_c0_g1::TRINITY_DN4255_c0_g1_i2::g.23966::m.23966/K02917/RP-L35Ae, RPL35A; large subunit ribosomal protein L35Ae